MSHLLNKKPKNAPHLLTLQHTYTYTFTYTYIYIYFLDNYPTIHLYPKNELPHYPPESWPTIHLHLELHIQIFGRFGDCSSCALRFRKLCGFWWWCSSTCKWGVWRTARFWQRSWIWFLEAEFWCRGAGNKHYKYRIFGLGVSFFDGLIVWPYFFAPPQKTRTIGWHPYFIVFSKKHTHKQQKPQNKNTITFTFANIIGPFDFDQKLLHFLGPLCWFFVFPLSCLLNNTTA